MCTHLSEFSSNLLSFPQPALSFVRYQLAITVVLELTVNHLVPYLSLSRDHIILFITAQEAPRAEFGIEQLPLMCNAHLVTNRC